LELIAKAKAKMLHTELENLLVESVYMEIANCMFEAKEIEEILFSSSIRLCSDSIISKCIGESNDRLYTDPEITFFTVH